MKKKSNKIINTKIELFMKKNLAIYKFTRCKTTALSEFRKTDFKILICILENLEKQFFGASFKIFKCSANSEKFIEPSLKTANVFYDKEISLVINLLMRRTEERIWICRR
ncbi:hypothetical protein BpHYR1_054593 [Brachionus plicatilis]|uniref:Uncharacterized protein n=1 Tax=Brachionus plicatilis TaxID=10195 RepID=A0A3M7QVL3_BRAPC|nr:hypothetical protein BpHYR1_054593 [Brachionus plicatilis]